MSSSPINPVAMKRPLPSGSEENANKRARTDSYPSTKADPTPFYYVTLPKVPYSPKPQKIPTVSSKLSHIIQIPAVPSKVSHVSQVLTCPSLPSQPRNPTLLPNSSQVKLQTYQPLPSQPRNPTLLPNSSQTMLPTFSTSSLEINKVVKSLPAVSFITQAQQPHRPASAKPAEEPKSDVPAVFGTSSQVSELPIFSPLSLEINKVMKSLPAVSFITQAQQPHRPASAKPAEEPKSDVPAVFGTSSQVSELPVFSPLSLEIHEVVKSLPAVSFVTQARQLHRSASAKPAGEPESNVPAVFSTPSQVSDETSGIVEEEVVDTDSEGVVDTDSSQEG